MMIPICIADRAGLPARRNGISFAKVRCILLVALPVTPLPLLFFSVEDELLWARETGTASDIAGSAEAMTVPCATDTPVGGADTVGAPDMFT